MDVYGRKFSVEEMAERNTQCRQIVGEIVNLPVTQDQIWFIVYLLGLELEDNDDMKALTAFVKERKGKNIFLSARAEEE